MQRYWFGDIYEDGRCVPAALSTESHPSGVEQPAAPDAAALAERLATLRTDMAHYTPPDWSFAVKCGLVRDREEYISRLREVCFLVAGQKIAEHYRSRDVGLLQMVRMLDEIDHVMNLLTERAGDWYQATHPKFSRKYRPQSAGKMLTLIRKGGGLPGRVAAEVARLSDLRKAIMREVSLEADAVLPNCSALVGGVVAARLVSRAGGLADLARMPASTVQVLGAGSSLFSHLRSGTPPPKHGIIFQHRRVHNAPRAVRGRVARVLAAKLSIAARLDYYRGISDPQFLRDAQARIDEAGVVP